MMARWTWIGLLEVILVGWTSAQEATAPSGPASVESPRQRVSAELHRILANLKYTEYSHPTLVDEGRGDYRCDCSGLACYVLSRQLPEHYQKIPIAPGQKRQRAMDFYAFFAGLPGDEKGRDGWRQVVRIVDALPGDVIAWRALEPKVNNTGHVVLVDGVPQVMADGQVRVTIIDSTTNPHENDTRSPGQTGIGRGTMYFTVDREGKPIGYRSVGPQGKLYERPIAIGRPVPLR